MCSEQAASATTSRSVQAGSDLARAQFFTSFLCSLSHLFFIHSLNTKAIPVQSVPSYAQVRKSHTVGLSALRGFQVVEKTDTESDNILSGRQREAGVHER